MSSTNDSPLKLWIKEYWEIFNFWRNTTMMIGTWGFTMISWKKTLWWKISVKLPVNTINLISVPSGKIDVRKHYWKTLSLSWEIYREHPKLMPVKFTPKSGGSSPPWTPRWTSWWAGTWTAASPGGSWPRWRSGWTPGPPCTWWGTPPATPPPCWLGCGARGWRM